MTSTIHVRGILVAGMWLIDCTVCGGVAVVDETGVDQLCLDHLDSHGIDTTDYRRTHL